MKFFIENVVKHIYERESKFKTIYKPISDSYISKILVGATDMGSRIQHIFESHQNNHVKLLYKPPRLTLLSDIRMINDLIAKLADHLHHYISSDNQKENSVNLRILDTMFNLTRQILNLVTYIM